MQHSAIREAKPRSSACRLRPTPLSRSGRYQDPRPVDALVVAKGNGVALPNEESLMLQPRSVAPVCHQFPPLPNVSPSDVHRVSR